MLFVVAAGAPYSLGVGYVAALWFKVTGDRQLAKW